MRRRQRLRLGGAIAALALLAAIGLRFVRFTVPRAQVALPHVELNAIEARIFGLVNAARAQAGAGPLALSERLGIAARAHAEDMAAHGYVAYESVAGDSPSDRVRAAGLDYEEVVENLLTDSDRDVEALPQRALAAWLASPATRNNLLAPRFREAAIAAAHAANGSFYISLDLMR